MRDKPPEECALCGRTRPDVQLVAGPVVRPAIADLIRASNPEWTPAQPVCRADLNRLRAQYVHSLLESERGELTSLETEVVRSMQEHELLAAYVDTDTDATRSRGEKAADAIAAFGGSWKFLALFGAFLALWIGVNSAVLLWRPADPYPFILLNLILSCLAAVQAPIIMMSQNRQEARDRSRAQHDYQVDLKAELEIRHLDEKVDHLLFQQWDRMAAMQEIQLEILQELGRRK